MRLKIDVTKRVKKLEILRQSKQGLGKFFPRRTVNSAASVSRGWRPFRNQDAFALFGCLVPVVVFFAHSSPAAATLLAVLCLPAACSMTVAVPRHRSIGAVPPWARARTVSAVSAMAVVGRCTVSYAYKLSGWPDFVRCLLALGSCHSISSCNLLL